MFVCLSLACIVYLTEAMSLRGWGAGGIVCSNGAVRKLVCVRVSDGTLRWRVTAVRNDQPYPRRYTGNRGKRGVNGDGLPLFTASRPYPYIERRPTSPAHHWERISEQSRYIISTRSEWERKWMDIFQLHWGNAQRLSHCLRACIRMDIKCICACMYACPLRFLTCCLFSPT